MSSLRSKATFMLHTSNILVYKLTEIFRPRVLRKHKYTLTIVVKFFGCKSHFSINANYIFNVHFLPHLHWNPKLYFMTGCNKSVIKFLKP
ncbi:RNase adapter RapZ [Candidatus Erwinia haradaeae]|uniref:RNase adapter RapZ n=1 Tax=Candidatus Erwinia haradaeae TaxID=1922217 RepID=UPI001300A8E3|nr:RNase adapter RapZ [Candidatus Erwinia haradaeae]